MKIFEKRPLAIILCVMLGGFSFFADFTWQIKLIAAVVPLVLIAQLFLFKTLNNGRKPLVIISLVAFSVSLILSTVWSWSFYPAKYYGQSVDIEGRVYSIDHSDPYSTSVVFKSKKINNKRDKHTFILYLDKEDATTVKRYDIVSLNAVLSEFSSKDDGFDGRSYYVSRGYSASLDNATSINVLENRPDRFNALLTGLQLKISNKLKLRTDFRTGAFLSALIVGDRNDLSGTLKLNFARLGISHILALSGMHLAILSLALNALMKQLGIKKHARVTLMIALVSLYVALTGFSASVLRAGLMLIISSLLYLLSSKSDSITSLSIAVFLIVAINPTSVYDLSLWLSAFATLGVIAFAEIAEKPDKDVGVMQKIWHSFKNGCLVSIFAICATFAFTLMRFNAFSIASIITTLLFSFVIQLFIYGGILLLLVGRFIPFGKLLIVFSNGIFRLAELISSWKLVYVSLDFFIVKLLIVILTVVFFSYLVLDVKNKKLGILAICSILLAIFVVAEVNTLIIRGRDDVIYTPSATGDTFLIKSDSDTCVVYSGRAQSRAGRDVLNTLVKEKITYLDTLIFASYSHSTIEFANVVLDGIKVGKIMLPTPDTVEELGQAEGLSYLLSEYGAHLEFYEPRKYVSIGEYKYRLFEKEDYTYGKSPQNVFEIVLSDKRITYITPGEYDNLTASAKALLYHTENLIIGTYSSTEKHVFNMRLPDIKQIYFHENGRLTEDALDYYKEKGASTNLVKTPFSLLN